MTDEWSLALNNRRRSRRSSPLEVSRKSLRNSEADGARGFVDNSGPAVWIKRLESRGIAKIPKGVVDDLEQLWGVRHLVVHSAGVATREFASRRTARKPVAGEPIKVSSAQLKSWTDSVYAFVRTVDAFYARYLPPGATPLLASASRGTTRTPTDRGSRVASGRRASLRVYARRTRGASIMLSTD